MSTPPPPPPPPSTPSELTAGPRSDLHPLAHPPQRTTEALEATGQEAIRQNNSDSSFRLVFDDYAKMLEPRNGHHVGASQALNPLFDCPAISHSRPSEDIDSPSPSHQFMEGFFDGGDLSSVVQNNGPTVSSLSMDSRSTGGSELYHHHIGSLSSLPHLQLLPLPSPGHHRTLDQPSQSTPTDFHFNRLTAGLDSPHQHASSVLGSSELRNDFNTGSQFSNTPQQTQRQSTVNHLTADSNNSNTASVGLENTHQLGHLLNSFGFFDCSSFNSDSNHSSMADTQLPLTLGGATTNSSSLPVHQFESSPLDGFGLFDLNQYMSQTNHNILNSAIGTSLNLLQCPSQELQNSSSPFGPRLPQHSLQPNSLNPFAHQQHQHSLPRFEALPQLSQTPYWSLNLPVPPTGSIALNHHPGIFRALEQASAGNTGSYQHPRQCNSSRSNSPPNGALCPDNRSHSTAMRGNENHNCRQTTTTPSNGMHRRIDDATTLRRSDGVMPQRGPLNDSNQTPTQTTLFNNATPFIPGQGVQLVTASPAASENIAQSMPPQGSESPPTSTSPSRSVVSTPLHCDQPSKSSSSCSSSDQETSAKMPPSHASLSFQPSSSSSLESGGNASETQSIHKQHTATFIQKSTRPRRPPHGGSTSVLGALLQRLFAIHNQTNSESSERNAPGKTQRKADAIAYAVNQLSTSELLQLLKNVIAFQNSRKNEDESRWCGSLGESQLSMENTQSGCGGTNDTSSHNSDDNAAARIFASEDLETIINELVSISGISDRQFLQSVACWCQQQSPLKSSLCHPTPPIFPILAAPLSSSTQSVAPALPTLATSTSSIPHVPQDIFEITPSARPSDCSSLTIRKVGTSPATDSNSPDQQISSVPGRVCGTENKSISLPLKLDVTLSSSEPTGTSSLRGNQHISVPCGFSSAPCNSPITPVIPFCCPPAITKSFPPSRYLQAVDSAHRPNLSPTISVSNSPFSPLPSRVPALLPLTAVVNTMMSKINTLQQALKAQVELQASTLSALLATQMELGLIKSGSTAPAVSLTGAGINENNDVLCSCGRRTTSAQSRNSRAYEESRADLQGSSAASSVGIDGDGNGHSQSCENTRSNSSTVVVKKSSVASTQSSMDYSTSFSVLEEQLVPETAPTMVDHPLQFETPPNKLVASRQKRRRSCDIRDDSMILSSVDDLIDHHLETATKEPPRKEIRLESPLQLNIPCIGQVDVGKSYKDESVDHSSTISSRSPNNTTHGDPSFKILKRDSNEEANFGSCHNQHCMMTSQLSSISSPLLRSSTLKLEEGCDQQKKDQNSFSQLFVSSLSSEFPSTFSMSPYRSPFSVTESLSSQPPCCESSDTLICTSPNGTRGRSEDQSWSTQTPIVTTQVPKSEACPKEDNLESLLSQNNSTSQRLHPASMDCHFSSIVTVNEDSSNLRNKPPPCEEMTPIDSVVVPQNQVTKVLRTTEQHNYKHEDNEYTNQDQTMPTLTPTPHEQCLLQLEALAMATPHWAEHFASFQWHRERLLRICTDPQQKTRDGNNNNRDNNGVQEHQEQQEERDDLADVTQQYLHIFLDDLDGSCGDQQQPTPMPPPSSPFSSSKKFLMAIISKHAIQFLSPTDLMGKQKESWELTSRYLCEDYSDSSLLKPSSSSPCSGSASSAQSASQIILRLQQAIELIPLWICRLDSYRQSLDASFIPLTALPPHLQTAAFYQFLSTYVDASAHQLRLLELELNKCVNFVCPGEEQQQHLTIQSVTAHRHFQQRPWHQLSQPPGHSTPASQQQQQQDETQHKTSPTSDHSMGLLSSVKPLAPPPPSSPATIDHPINATHITADGAGSSPYFSEFGIMNSTPISSQGSHDESHTLECEHRASISLPPAVSDRSPSSLNSSSSATTNGRRMMLMVCTAKPTAAGSSSSSNTSSASINSREDGEMSNNVSFPTPSDPGLPTSTKPGATITSAQTVAEVSSSSGLPLIGSPAHVTEVATKTTASTAANTTAIQSGTGTPTEYPESVMKDKQQAQKQCSPEDKHPRSEESELALMSAIVKLGTRANQDLRSLGQQTAKQPSPQQQQQHNNSNHQPNSRIFPVQNPVHPSAANIAGPILPCGSILPPNGTMNGTREVVHDFRTSSDPSPYPHTIVAPSVPNFTSSDDKSTPSSSPLSSVQDCSITCSKNMAPQPTNNHKGGRSSGVQGVVWKPEEDSWIAFWQDPTTNQQQIRRFPITQFGAENAKKMAMKCRREADKQLTASVMIGSRSNGSNNIRGESSATVPQLPRSEVPGVYWYRNRNGWVAQWFENGKNKHKFFAASVFGVEGAKQKAIAYRLMKLEEKKLKGW